MIAPLTSYYCNQRTALAQPHGSTTSPHIGPYAAYGLKRVIMWREETRRPRVRLHWQVSREKLEKLET